MRHYRADDPGAGRHLRNGGGVKVRGNSVIVDGRVRTQKLRETSQGAHRIGVRWEPVTYRKHAGCHCRCPATVGTRGERFMAKLKDSRYISGNRGPKTRLPAKLQ